MGEPLTKIRNIGPAMAEALSAAGITSADELRVLGPDAAYERYITHGHRPHFIAYYALVMGLQGRPWNDCQGDEKKALRVRFDGIVAASKGPVPAFIRALDEVGVTIDAEQLANTGKDG